MKKIALFLVFVLYFSVLVPFAVSAETIPVTYEVLKDIPERTPGLDCYEVLTDTHKDFILELHFPQGCCKHCFGR